MDLGLTGRTALVTGASRGFGRATALALAAEGAHVGMGARGAADLEAAAEEVRGVARARAARAGGEPARVWAAPVDVADGEALARFVAAAGEALGPPDCCLVNGGGPPAAAFLEAGDEAWEAAVRLLLLASVRLCRLVLPGMMARGWGRIVQVASVSVRQPVPNLVLSNVVRPAVHALTRNLAVEAAPRGVTVNTVAPGFHLTSAVERLIARKLADGTAASRREALSQWEQEIPAGRLGRPEELAALIAFLFSEPAGYLTGQLICADGGWVRSQF